MYLPSGCLLHLLFSVVNKRIGGGVQCKGVIEDSQSRLPLCTNIQGERDNKEKSKNCPELDGGRDNSHAPMDKRDVEGDTDPIKSVKMQEQLVPDMPLVDTVLSKLQPVP